MKRCVFCSLVILLLLSGCTTNPALKGSPFYSTFYERHEKPDPDRTNTILTYYSYGTWYVPWGLPLAEFGPEYQAVRPLYSAYDRNTDNPVYSMLWPIGRFDPGRRRYRIFPLYWGDEYFNVVPLYWHSGDPFSGVGHNALLPFWMWSRSDAGHYLGIVWPLHASYRYPDRSGWWLWPAYGSLHKGDSGYRYLAWPFIHSFSSAGSSGHTVVPLWYYNRTDKSRNFYSLLYSRSMVNEPGATSWDLTLPLCYRAWAGDSFRWAVIPALSWGQNGAQFSDAWFALGLGHYGRVEDGLSHHVIPVYLYSRDSEARRLYTLPWWSKQYTDGTGWNMLFPVYYYGNWGDARSVYSVPWLSKKRVDGSGWHATIPIYYRGYAENASSFYSLAWLYRRSPDGSRWHTTIPLYLRTRSEDRDAWYTLPYSRVRNADGSGWNTAIPFYYRGYTANSSALYSLLWLSEKHADGSEWEALFPVYFGSRSDAGSLLMTPVYARKKHPDGASAWRCYIPFVYFKDDYDAHFMTLLGGRWRMGENQTWLALPLLSGGTRDADSGRNVWLAGLAGNRWDEQGGSSYVIPVYYASPNAVVSLPYASWLEGDRKNTVCPPILSGWYREDDVSGGWFAAGLVGYRTGEKEPFQYVFPFYYHDPDKTLSLAYASWRRDDRKTTVVPWLLSGWYRENEVSGSVMAAGLAGYRRGDEDAYSYLFPLFYTAPEKGSFLSPLFVKWKSGERENSIIPLLLSGWCTEPNARDVLLAGGLAGWRTEEAETAATHLLPFWMWAKDDYLYTLPVGYSRRKNYYATPLVGSYRPGSGKSGSWAVPFYWHRRYLDSGSVKGYYFPLGYYNESANRINRGFLGVYDYLYSVNEFSLNDAGRSGRFMNEYRSLQYLLFFGNSTQRWTYELEGDDRTLTEYRKRQSLFPFWSRRVSKDLSSRKETEDASVLLALYNVRHEQDIDRDYTRHQILWRLYRSESINGDTFTDLPGVTINSYSNGRREVEVLWRLFRYEKNPESGERKLDLLFIPFKR